MIIHSRRGKKHAGKREQRLPAAICGILLRDLSFVVITVPPTKRHTRGHLQTWDEGMLALSVDRDAVGSGARKSPLAALFQRGLMAFEVFFQGRIER
jgi:hypothetical protein